MPKNTKTIKGKRFMAKVANAVFEVNGEIAFTAFANTDSSVSVETSSEDIRGGQGNQIIGSIVSESSVNVTFNTPEWKIEFLAANVGSEITVGNKVFMCTSKTAAVVDGKFTLPEIPEDNVIYVDVNDTWVKVPIEAAEITLESAGLPNNMTCVKYMGLFNKFGKEVVIKSNTDPLIGNLTLTAPIYENTGGEVGEGEYEFPAFQLSGNWTHGMSNGTPGYEISGKALAVESDRCGDGQIYGYYREHINNDDNANKFGRIAVAPSEAELAVGETETLAVYGYKSGLYAPSKLTSGVVYSSSDSSKATVDAETGLVTAVAEGTATITAAYDGLTSKSTIEITAA